MRERAIAIVAAVVVAVWILGHSTAAEASCVGPSLGVDRASVARGEVLEIRGLYFGTACNDTGQRGPTLGAPQSFIALRIVQGDIAVTVAVVNAARDYRFVVRVSVPTELASGPAKVTARSSGGETSAAIVINEGAAIGGAPAAAIFVVGSDSGLPRVEPAQDSEWWVAAGVLAVLVAAALVGVVLYRRDQRRPHRWI